MSIGVLDEEGLAGQGLSREWDPAWLRPGGRELKKAALGMTRGECARQGKEETRAGEFSPEDRESHG